MFKIIFSLLVYVNLLVANTFGFSELRYSDATGKYIQNDGQITFLKDGLKIFYPKGLKLLHYEDDSLVYKENKEEIQLNEMQAQQIMRYFDMIILIHQGDEKAYEEIFEVHKKGDIMQLTPLGDLKNYISKIELLKYASHPKHIKLFLQNNDSITINIDDEI